MNSTKDIYQKFREEVNTKNLTEENVWKLYVQNYMDQDIDAAINSNEYDIVTNDIAEIDECDVYVKAFSKKGRYYHTKYKCKGKDWHSRLRRVKKWNKIEKEKYINKQLLRLFNESKSIGFKEYYDIYIDEDRHTYGVTVDIVW